MNLDIDYHLRDKVYKKQEIMLKIYKDKVKILKELLINQVEKVICNKNN